MNYIIKDRKTGNPLLTCDLPDGFESSAYLEFRQFTTEQRVHIEAEVSKGKCTFGYKTGEAYIYEKKPCSLSLAFHRQRAGKVKPVPGTPLHYH